jgi:hypothetical protein
LESLLIHVAREGDVLKIEFICFDKLQEIFIERTLKWIENFYLFSSGEFKGKGGEEFIEAVYGLLLFSEIFCVIGCFKENNMEKKKLVRLRRKWIRQVLAF